MAEPELTKLEQAIIETHKPTGEETQWYIQVAGPCLCRPKKGFSAGICRLINAICDYDKCPIRMQILWHLK